MIIAAEKQKNETQRIVCVYSKSEIETAWFRALPETIQRGENCYTKKCTKAEALVLSAAFLRNIFANVKCLNYDGDTLCFYLGLVSLDDRKDALSKLKEIIEEFNLLGIVRFGDQPAFQEDAFICDVVDFSFSTNHKFLTYRHQTTTGFCLCDFCIKLPIPISSTISEWDAFCMD